ncbi:MAG TPA: hypothetical protein VMZ90_08515 [Vicinamibacterales bacterium]|nr:hypothetical protein [Vicinamibacterales bacterium]
MRLLALPAILVMGLFVVHGVLLMFRPDLFLRLHDFLNPGDRWRNATWRKDVHGVDWKLLGLLFFAVGLVAIGMLMRKLLS